MKDRNPLVTAADEVVLAYEEDEQSEGSSSMSQSGESQHESRLEDLDPQDLEAIALIYDNIRELRR